MENQKELVKSFYNECLTVNSETNVSELLGKILSENFQSENAKESKSKAALIGQVQFFWKLIRMAKIVYCLLKRQYNSHGIGLMFFNK